MRVRSCLLCYQFTYPIVKAILGIMDFLGVFIVTFFVVVTLFLATGALMGMAHLHINFKVSYGVHDWSTTRIDTPTGKGRNSRRRSKKSHAMEQSRPADFYCSLSTSANLSTPPIESVNDEAIDTEDIAPQELEEAKPETDLTKQLCSTSNVITSPRDSAPVDIKTPDWIQQLGAAYMAARSPLNQNYDDAVTSTNHTTTIVQSGITTTSVTDSEAVSSISNNLKTPSGFSEITATSAPALQAPVPISNIKDESEDDKPDEGSTFLNLKTLNKQSEIVEAPLPDPGTDTLSHNLENYEYRISTFLRYMRNHCNTMPAANSNSEVNDFMETAPAFTDLESSDSNSEDYEYPKPEQTIPETVQTNSDFPELTTTLESADSNLEGFDFSELAAYLTAHEASDLYPEYFDFLPTDTKSKSYDIPKPERTIPETVQSTSEVSDIPELAASLTVHEAADSHPEVSDFPELITDSTSKGCDIPKPECTIPETAQSNSEVSDIPELAASLTAHESANSNPEGYEFSASASDLFISTETADSNPDINPGSELEDGAMIDEPQQLQRITTVCMHM